jgi:hypothetical protein
VAEFLLHVLHPAVDKDRHMANRHPKKTRAHSDYFNGTHNFQSI